MKKLIILFAMIMGFMFESKSADLGGLVDSTKQFVKEIKDSAVAEVRAIDTSSTFKLMYSDFKQGIVALASSLKVGTEHVYFVLVKQQIVYAVVWLVTFIIGFLLVLNWIKQYKNKDEIWWMSGRENPYSNKSYPTGSNESYPTGLGIVRFIQILVCLTMLITSIFNFDVIMTGFINPEYGAIRDVIEMVKTIAK
jgi:hypothetical protein